LDVTFAAASIATPYVVLQVRISAWGAETLLLVAIATKVDDVTGRLAGRSDRIVDGAGRAVGLVEAVGELLLERGQEVRTTKKTATAGPNTHHQALPGFAFSHTRPAIQIANPARAGAMTIVCCHRGCRS
jgi:hypothetical protein